MTIPCPGFTGSLLDRADEVRHDEAKLAEMRAHPGAGLLLLDALLPVTGDTGGLAFAPLAEAPAGVELALLGRLGGAPSFVALTPGVSALSRSPTLFDVIGSLPPGEAGTYATARSLVDWHSRHRFCANCGNETGVFRAGWGRVCPACGTEHFPRVDPVVIMLAQHGEGADARILVGRQPAFPANRYSALAGFLEPGESIEAAVARELFEEAGVRVSGVRYVASQPWPFPSQLMIACIGHTDDDRLTIDHSELEDAKWVSREGVAAALADAPDAPFLPPPPYAIAHTLFARWLMEANSPSP
jgi:NAD+ diphosphatase